MTTKKETTTNPRRAKALRQARERMDDLATRLAQELGIETLEPRNLDRYDFHEVGVAGHGSAEPTFRLLLFGHYTDQFQIGPGGFEQERGLFRQ